MEDLRFQSTVTAGRRLETEAKSAFSKGEGPEEGDFRSFLSESNPVDGDGTIDGGGVNSIGLNQGPKTESETLSTVNTLQTLTIHSRSNEIGRVIFTGDSIRNDDVSASMESLNAEADSLLTRLVDKDEGTTSLMLEHIRATMLGAKEVASNLSRAGSFAELTNDQLNMLASSRSNSWSDATQSIASTPPFSSAVALKHVSTESQSTLGASDLSTTENGGVIKEHIALSIAPNGDTSKLVKPLTVDVLSDWGSTDVDLTQPGANSSRGDSSDQDGGQRGSEKQDPDKRSDSFEKDRQDWRERFAEIINDRIKVKVDEGEWLVRISLKAVGLGSFDFSLESNDHGIFGSIRSDDPEVREILNSTLPELKRALNESLSSAGRPKIILEVVDNNNLSESRVLADGPEIILSASELSNSLPERFKAGDGLDVFV